MPQMSPLYWGAIVIVCWFALFLCAVSKSPSVSSPFSLPSGVTYKKELEWKW